MADDMRVTDVEHWLDRLYIDAEGAGLRDEDRKKALEVSAMLDEIERAARRFSRRAPLVMVDAAAGKSYVGLLAARLVFEPMGMVASVITIERDAVRAAIAREAIARLGTSIPIECRAADVDEAEAWPAEPSIVTALHACGGAADAIIDRVVATRARELLLVPCCTSKGVAAAVAGRSRCRVHRHPAARAGPPPVHPGDGGRGTHVAARGGRLRDGGRGVRRRHRHAAQPPVACAPRRRADANGGRARGARAARHIPAMSWIPTDRPLVFGHRGGSRLAPENTIAAFDRAVAEGVDGLELDVRLSKDGQVMVCHDARVDRTSNTTGAIADMTASELERVDAGYRFRSDALTYPFRWRGFGVPRLADVLARYPRHPFIVEMKDNTRAMAEATVEVIRAAGALDRVCLGAFQLRVLTYARRLAPDASSGASSAEVLRAMFTAQRGPPSAAPPLPGAAGARAAQAPPRRDAPLRQRRAPGGCAGSSVDCGSRRGYPPAARLGRSGDHHRPSRYRRAHRRRLATGARRQMKAFYRLRVRRRRTAAPSPRSPVPRRTIEAGSGFCTIWTSNTKSLKSRSEPAHMSSAPRR